MRPTITKDDFLKSYEEYFNETLSERPIGTYDLTTALNSRAKWNIITSERSVGKTYIALEFAIFLFVNSNYTKQSVYIRRHKDMLETKKLKLLFGPIVADGRVITITGGKYTTVNFDRGAFYLSNFNTETGKYENHLTPFMYVDAISTADNTKGFELRDVEFVIIEECMPTSGNYLRNEWLLFKVLTGTYIRSEAKITFFLLGNTISPYSIYYQNFKIEDPEAVPPGGHLTFTHKNLDISKDELTIFYERCAYPENERSNKKSNVYWLMEDDDASSMNTRADYEIPVYPKGFESDYKVVYTFQIKHYKRFVTCEVRCLENGNIFIYHKKSNYRYEDTLLFTLEEINDPLAIYDIFTIPFKTRATIEIQKLYSTNKVAFETDSVGALVTQYFKDAHKSNRLHL